jgi:hypothetical protein
MLQSINDKHIKTILILEGALYIPEVADNCQLTCQEIRFKILN